MGELGGDLVGACAGVHLGLSLRGAWAGLVRALAGRVGFGLA